MGRSAMARMASPGHCWIATLALYLENRQYAPVAAYDVVEIPAGIEREIYEQLGSKEKFWFRHNDGERWLFKYSRLNTGEHWAEKVASEVAERLQLPHARVELATFEGHWGSIALDFTQDGRHDLVHGNELLTELDPQYPSGDTYHVSAHTVDAVFDVLTQSFVAAPGSASLPDWLGAFDLFIGYLLLDAVIGNTDRHHENWGVLSTSTQPRKVELAPTFDHASSLGRELTDTGRTRKYGTARGAYRVDRYLDKARSALFETPSSARPLRTLEAFRKAASLSPAAGQYWIGRLRESFDELRSVLECVPRDVITPTSREFAYQLLRLGAERLLE